MKTQKNGACFPPHAEINFFIAATEIISEGLQVFPCRPDKTPYTRHGHLDASTSLEQVALWSQKFPDALPGVPTGEKSGFIVLDIDVKNGKNGFQTLKNNGWQLPPTMTHETPNGHGRHCFFKFEPGISNSASQLGPGLDVRSSGGYVVWWDQQVSNPGVLAAIPKWLFNGLKNKPHGSPDDFSQDPILAGQRNDVLFRQASKWRSQGLDYSKILLLLRAENKLRCVPPLADGELNKIAGSAAGFDTNEKNQGKLAELAELAAGSPSVYYEPEPLRAPLPRAEDFPVESLGEVLGPAALALHETIKAPLTLCCQSLLASASLAAQAHFDVKLPWGETRPLSLFLLTVAESGERKSGVDDVVLGAAKALERRAMAEYAVDNGQHEIDMAGWKEAGKAKTQAQSDDAASAKLQMEAKPAAPVMPLRFTSDPTVEGIYRLLTVGQPSIGLFSDEGGLLIGGHALNSDNALKTMARLCKLWAGDAFDRVRGGDGSSVLYGRRLAMHQLAQPEVMAQLLGDRLANGQGLLARCLVAWPESTIGSRHITLFEQPRDRVEVKRLFAKLITLMEAEPATGATAQELEPKELPLSDQAKKMAVAAMNEFETLMKGGNDLAELRDRTSKALENACRIAGVITVVEDGLSATVIDADRLGRALVIIQWYLQETLRIRGSSVVPQAVHDAESLSKWLNERDYKMFRTAHVLTNGPNPLRNKKRLDSALHELASSGYISENPMGTVINGVSARKSWRVNHVV